MRLINPAEYIIEATNLIKLAERRISIVSLVVTDDEVTDQFIDALVVAAERGVQVQVAADMFTYTEINGNFMPTHYYGKRVRSTTKMARELLRAGVKFTWLGRLNIASFSGRTHSKWCVVDDTVFSFGGVNLYAAATKNNDYMLTVADQKMADALVTEHAKIVQADKKLHAYRSHSTTINQSDRILFDGGLFGNSIIYNRAVELTKQSSSVTLVSQYCPTGKLARTLKKTDSTIYFNDGRQTTPINRFIIRSGMWVTGLKTDYSQERYLHAKCIIFQLADGSKRALSGSHNFVFGGTLLGTREIALETSNSETIAQIENFIAHEIA